MICCFVVDVCDEWVNVMSFVDCNLIVKFLQWNRLVENLVDVCGGLMIQILCEKMDFILIDVVVCVGELLWGVSLCDLWILV